MKKQKYFRCLLTIFLSVALHICTPSLYAQTMISGVINQYARILSLDTCDMRLTLSSATGFSRGMEVLIIQSNGCQISDRNSAEFGTLQNLRNTGFFEFNRIDSISGNSIFLNRHLLNQYDFDASVQLISVPNYQEAIVTDTLRPLAWNGLIGGTLVFRATTLTLRAPIDASGAGFRGGRAPNPFTTCSAGSSALGYAYPASSEDGAPKGEGLAPYIAGKENGRGAQLNGGGGGNNHNAGGGGGANINAGGQGGINDEPRTFGCKGDAPGSGGRAMSLTNNRIYMGGGGGAGHDNNLVATSGGNGGGIIIIKANTIIGDVSNVAIASNGMNALNAGGDGAGGGGAGGTILLEVDNIINAISIQAKGGNGGSTNNGGQDRCMGPGGGGSGGRVMVKGAVAIGTNVTAGQAGQVLNSTACSGTNRASNGVLGTINSFSANTVLLFASDRAINRTLSVSAQPLPSRTCMTRTATFSVTATGAGLTYQWQMDNGSGFQNLSNINNFSTVNTSILRISNIGVNLQGARFRCIVTTTCEQPHQTITSNDATLSVIELPVPAFRADTTAGSNIVRFNNTSLNAVRVRWQFGDGNTSTLLNPTYRYLLQGNYRVTLTAYNECDSISINLPVVLDSRPKANFSGSSVGECVPAQTAFSNLVSDNTISWIWEFPGGSPAISTDTSPVVNYTSSGNFDVILIAINANGRDTLRRTAFIRAGGAPRPSFTWVRSGLTISFSGISGGGTSLQWNFGDGQSSLQTNPQHTYRNAGTYIVSLSASNACGLTEIRDTLVLLNLPSAVVTASPRVGCTPMRVQYSGQNATNVNSWRWSFPGGIPSVSVVQNPVVTYTQPGIYSATLVISNSAGNSSFDLPNFVTVVDAPSADFGYRVVGNTVTFQNRSTSAIQYNWDFGNGETSSRTDAEFNYVYARDGNYTVTLTIQNPFCGAATSRNVAINYTSTKDLDTEGGILIFPNPTFSTFTLTTDSPDEMENAQLFSPQGELVAALKLAKSPQQTIDISNFPNGLYILKILNKKNTIVKKILKF